MDDTLTEGQIRYRKYKASYIEYRKTHPNRENPEKRRIYNKNHPIIPEKRIIYHDQERFAGNKKVILKRDNYQCQICGMTDEEHLKRWGREITVDHIDGNGRYSGTQNNTLENLITLCLICHGRKDKMRALKGKRE